MDVSRLTAQQREAYLRPWHNRMAETSPVLDVFPSGEQVGLSINK
jgi:hypothetical protein